MAATLHALPHGPPLHLSSRWRVSPPPGKGIFKCSLEKSTSREDVSRHVFSCLSASLIFCSPVNKAIGAELTQYSNICHLATITENSSMLKLEDTSGGGNGMLMMRGMTAKNFDPIRYSGRWFEVASLKRGFAGQGQEDCHCTQGIYTFDPTVPSIQVDTFCVHGSPDGYITGIRGKVQCLSEEDTGKQETNLERQVMIREKCYLRFPTLPFIPKEPYDVIATDYDTFSLVSGANDRSFIQLFFFKFVNSNMDSSLFDHMGHHHLAVFLYKLTLESKRIYSRTPNPGPAFIEKYKSYLADFGYDPSKIKDTPQDCEVMTSNQLAVMMSMSGMQKALTNQFPELELKSPLQLNPFTSIFDTLKKLIELYFK